MKTFIQNGNIITVTAAANIASGDGVLIGSIFGVAATEAVAGDEVEIGTVGIYELPKLSTAVIAQGDRVAWNNSTGKVVVSATGMYPIGVATEAAGNGVATVKVRLDGIATVAV
jgi:predicted RecA/RadA family phage recombinase